MQTHCHAVRAAGTAQRACSVPCSCCRRTTQPLWLPRPILRCRLRLPLKFFDNLLQISLGCYMHHLVVRTPPLHTCMPAAVHTWHAG